MSDRGEKKFIRGVMILTPATLLAKIIGLFYKIPLLHIVGVEGMAYFLSAYHVYSLLFVLFASGLPTALSLLVSRCVAAGEGRGVPRVFAVSLGVFFTLGFGFSALLLLFSEEVAAALAMRAAARSLAAIAPALFLSAFNGAVRGLFQGHRNMLPTALSEVTEAAGKLIFGIAFARKASALGADAAGIAAAAVLGITVGVLLASLLLLAALLACQRQLFCRDEGEVAKPHIRAVLAALLRIALPITVSASVMSLVSLTDTVLISARLQAIGYAPGAANALYSSFGNLAVPLYNLVPSLLSPVALSLTPALGAAFASKNGEGAQRAFSTALRLVALVALPAALGLSAFAYPILSLLYRGQGQAIAVAAPLLSILAPAVLPAALISLTAAALQAAGHTVLPLCSMLSGAAVKLLSEALLLTFGAINIYGAPISTLLCNLTVLAINLAAMRRVMPTRLHLSRDLLRPLLAAVLAVAAGALPYRLLFGTFGNAWWLTVGALLLVVLAYAALALLLRAVEKEDIIGLPCGELLVQILTKMHFLREETKNDERRKVKADFGKGYI